MRMDVRAATLSLSLSLSLCLPVCLLAGMEVGKVQVLQVEPVGSRDLLLLLLVVLVLVGMAPFRGA